VSGAFLTGEASKWEPQPDPPGWKSKAKFHDALLVMGGNRVHLRSTTGRVTLKVA
jgi:hypothetical protein